MSCLTPRGVVMKFQHFSLQPFFSKSILAFLAQFYSYAYVFIICLLFCLGDAFFFYYLEILFLYDILDIEFLVLQLGDPSVVLAQDFLKGLCVSVEINVYNVKCHEEFPYSFFRLFHSV